MLILFIILARFNFKKITFALFSIITGFIFYVIFISNNSVFTVIIPRLSSKFSFNDMASHIRIESIINTFEHIKTSHLGKGFDYIDVIPAHSRNHLILLYHCSHWRCSVYIYHFYDNCHYYKIYSRKKDIDRDYFWMFILTLIASLFFPLMNAPIGLYILSLSLSIILSKKKS